MAEADGQEGQYKPSDERVQEREAGMSIRRGDFYAFPWYAVLIPVYTQSCTMLYLIWCFDQSTYIQGHVDRGCAGGAVNSGSY